MTEAEKIFALRMLPHLTAGMTFEQAGRAVLADDARIMNAALADDGHLAIQTWDGAKSCSTTGGRLGATIRRELTQTVYSRLRAA